MDPTMSRAAGSFSRSGAYSPNVVRIETGTGAGYCINLDLVAWAEFQGEGEGLHVDIRFPAAEPVVLDGAAAQAFLNAFSRRGA